MNKKKRCKYYCTLCECVRERERKEKKRAY